MYPFFAMIRMKSTRCQIEYEVYYNYHIIKHLCGMLNMQTLEFTKIQIIVIPHSHKIKQILKISAKFI